MTSPLEADTDTLYLSVADVIRIVRRKGLPACLAGVAARIERDFLRWHEFDKSARVASHSARGVIELMPIADAEHFAFKYVNGHPGNTRDGLPTVMAFGVLADVATGAPRLLSELTLTTAIRTAAMSALAARARDGVERPASAHEDVQGRSRIRAGDAVRRQETLHGRGEIRRARAATSSSIWASGERSELLMR